MKRRRVGITGIGVISPVGNDRQTFWRHLTKGQSGIGLLTLFDANAFPVRIAGEVKDFEPHGEFARYGLDGTVRDRKAALALKAAREAILDSGLKENYLSEAVLQLGMGLESFCLEDLTTRAENMDLDAAAGHVLRRNGNCLMQAPLDLTADILGGRYGFFAGRFVNCSACAAGAQVIGQGWQMIVDGQADIVLAGAADSMLNPLGLGGFSLLRVLSNENDNPQQACRPFDATRKGTVLGEGAGFVMLEEFEHAMIRKARLYAEVLGYGSSMDAFRVSDPDPDGSGAIRSMMAALDSAKISAADVDAVNAHATGTPKNDCVETAVIKAVLGQRAYAIPVHAVKSMTGHLIAASGAVEAVASAFSLAYSVIPPTINLTTFDSQCDLDYVTEGARSFNGRTVLSNSFGFGGQNATLIFGRYIDEQR